ncbi:MAG TPA: glycosyltransferase family 4 protein [Vicinamibacteria bacterium]|nr:glycosyltransferase family 4 protein [Vicinamibacteria bacterium]
MLAFSMRVLHLADRLSDRGGACVWMRGVIDALSADHEVVLVVGSDDDPRRPAWPVRVRPGLEARTAVPVPLDDLASGADLVHLHNVVNPAVLEWAAGRTRALLTVQDHRFFCPGRGKWTAAGEVCRLPLSRERCAACFEHDGYFREVHALTARRLAAAAALSVTVLSRYMRDELVAAGVPAARVSVVPPFVTDLSPAADGAPGESCVLFVGRLAEAKGVLAAVSAWRLSGVPLPLVLAGTGPLRRELERQAQVSAGPPLRVLGWVDRQRLASLYARARALLLPPLWQEPFGIVGLEAAAFGVPVVGWESGGVAEWHEGPPLVPWGDVPALGRALREAVDRREPRRLRFRRDEAIALLLSVYERVAAARGRD